MNPDLLNQMRADCESTKAALDVLAKLRGVKVWEAAELAGVSEQCIRKNGLVTVYSRRTHRVLLQDLLAFQEKRALKAAEDAKSLRERIFGERRAA